MERTPLERGAEARMGDRLRVTEVEGWKERRRCEEEEEKGVGKQEEVRLRQEAGIRGEKSWVAWT